MNYYGDFKADDTVYIIFNTYDSDGASVTVTNLASTDVHIHKDGGTTQRSSSAGITVSIDFDGITGNHLIAIDLSDNTDAGFYATGSDFQARVEGITVDTQTINSWVGSYSIENRSALMPTTAGRTLDVTATGAAGIDWANVENPTTAVDLSQTDIQLCDTVTTNTDMVGTDNAALASVCTEGRLSELDAANIPSDIDNILTDTGTTIPASIAGLNDISLSDIFTYAIEGAETFEQFQRAFMAILVNKSNGGGTGTINYRDVADSKNRVTGTVDANNNRTARTVDLT